jgi:hypothetical protein
MNARTRKVMQACIIYLLKHYQRWVNIILNGKWARVPIIST